MKKVFLVTGIIAMTALILLYPENCLNGARYGLNLWFTIVLPSLLPFMVASFILLETGIIKLISFLLSPFTRVLFSAPGESAYVFFAAAFSGYPVGAKLAGELYEKGQVSEAEAQAIVRFTSVTGPVFIAGAVSAGMLGIPETAVYLLAAHYLSAFLTGVFFGLFKRNDAPKKHISFKEAFIQFKYDIRNCKPLGELLSESIEKAIMTLLRIGGFIIVFSVVMEMLSVSGVMDAAAWIYSPISNLTGFTSEGAKAILIGGIELTNGCSAAASLNIDIVKKLSIISSILAFGGLCVHMQTKSVCLSSGLTLKYFFAAKCLQAVFAYLFCSLSLIVFPMTIQTSNFGGEIKNAAYFGIVFAAASLLFLLIIKYIQRCIDKDSFLTFRRKL